ncbi:MAG: (d)CMP kinase [Verrucomicrobiales bacterium]|nr:(d)CMP kinase [Verrucomicrobiales bacterium]
MGNPLIIAIDGPAASGKSTVARRVARKLECVFVNSGEMYRAFTWWTLHNQVDPNDTVAVVKLLEETQFTCGEEDLVGYVEVQGRRLTEEEMKNDAVNSSVSAIAAIAEVRARLVAEQRAFAAESSLVMEGRDIGTVVFPDTPYKFFIDASPEIRAARRSAEGIEDSIEARDLADSMRTASPLKVATDAMVIDSSFMGVDEVVDLVVDAIQWKSTPNVTS